MSPESLLQQFDVMAEAPNGVQKLRQLILQLAVRGQIVRQDPTDAEATRLLDRICTARDRLDRGQGAGTPKHGIVLPNDAAPYAIPESWRWVRLSALGEVVGGGTPKTEVAAYWSDAGGIPWLTPADLNSLRGKYAREGRRQISQSGLEKSSSRLLPAGAVLFSSRAPIGYVAIAANPLATNQGFKSCVPYISGMSEYLFRFLQAVAPEVDRNAPGTTFREVSGKIVGQIPVALPPLQEQQRIVAKVDELMALCDELDARQQRRAEARARLNRSLLHHLATACHDVELASFWQRLRENFGLVCDSPKTVAEIRQTVIELAVRGRLVRQDPTEGKASVVLARVAAEQRKLSEEGVISAAKATPLIREADMAYALPDGWQWARFADLTLSIEAGWSPSCEPRPRRADEWGVLKISAVSWNVFDPDENKALPSNLDPRPQYEVRAGDFLMSRANTAELVGRSVVVSETPPRLLLSDKVLRVRVPKSVDAEYLNLFNGSAAARTYYAGQASGTSNSMRNLSREQILRLLVALPPLAEQRRIVARVDGLMALCDRLEAQLTRTRTLSLNLAASVVHYFTAA